MVQKLSRHTSEMKEQLAWTRVRVQLWRPLSGTAQASLRNGLTMFTAAGGVLSAPVGDYLSKRQPSRSRSCSLPRRINRGALRAAPQLPQGTTPKGPPSARAPSAQSCLCPLPFHRCWSRELHLQHPLRRKYNSKAEGNFSMASSYSITLKNVHLLKMQW